MFRAMYFSLTYVFASCSDPFTFISHVLLHKKTHLSGLYVVFALRYALA